MLFGFGRMRADSVVALFALEADMKVLRSIGTEVAEPRPWYGGKLYFIQLGRHQVRATLMQSGCIESSITAATLLSRERPDWLISVGVAGSLNDSHPRGTWLGVGELTSNGSMQPAGATPVEKLAIAGDDPALRSALPDVWKGTASVRLLSVGRFVHNDSEREGLRGESGADLVDMNLLGIVRACQRAGVKSLHWRIVSDWANVEAGRDFREFVVKYDGVGGRALAEFVKALPVSRERPEAYPQLDKLIQSIEVKP